MAQQHSSAPPVRISRRAVLGGIWSAGALTLCGYGIWQYNHDQPRYYAKLGGWWNVWSPDGILVASHTGLEGNVLVWEAETGKQRLSVAQKEAYGVAWSSDGGQLVVSSGFKKNLQIWDVQSGKHARTIPLPHDRLLAESPAWSLDNRLIYISGKDYQDKKILARAVDATTGKEMLRFVGDSELDTSNSLYAPLSMSRDGRYIAVICTVRETQTQGTRVVYIWEAVTGKLQFAFRASQLLYSPNPFQGAAWSPSGTHIAICNFAEYKIDILDIARKVVVFTYDKYKANVYSIAWSPDGKYIASASRYNLDIWHAFTGELIREYSIPAELLALAWSPDGRRLVGSDSDGNAWICSME